jgi:hypothetical protein
MSSALGDPEHGVGASSGSTTAGATPPD